LKKSNEDVISMGAKSGDMAIKAIPEEVENKLDTLSEGQDEVVSVEATINLDDNKKKKRTRRGKRGNNRNK